MPGVGTGDVAGAGAGGLAINRVAGAGLWVTLQLKYRPAGAQTNDIADGRSTLEVTETRHILWL